MSAVILSKVLINAAEVLFFLYGTAWFTWFMWLTCSLTSTINQIGLYQNSTKTIFYVKVTSLHYKAAEINSQAARR